MALSIPRKTYVDLYGPTQGGRVRLADSELIIEIERDFTVYGDEITFGGGKVIRDGMGQSSRATREDGVLGTYPLPRTIKIGSFVARTALVLRSSELSAVGCDCRTLRSIRRSRGVPLRMSQRCRWEEDTPP